MSSQEWIGNVWIRDHWTEEDKNHALHHITACHDTSYCNASNGTQAQFLKRQQHEALLLHRFHKHASTNWNAFYELNHNKFFKDRHYLHKAFPIEFGWLYPGYLGHEIKESDNIETVTSAELTSETRPLLENDYDTTTRDPPLQHRYKNIVRIVEIGCGVGNAILPLLEHHSEMMKQCSQGHKYNQNQEQQQQQCVPKSVRDNNNKDLTSSSESIIPMLHIHCLDFAPNAIQILNQDPRFQTAAKEGLATSHVYDLSSMHPSTIPISQISSMTIGPTNNVQEQTLHQSADVAILLFCLSAVGPYPSVALSRAAHHVIDMLKPGGTLVFRDYGRLDEAQQKLGRAGRNNELTDNFYRKGDGTGCYYFELNDLRELFGNTNGGRDEKKLNILELEYIQRIYRNRGDGTTRRRVWVQGRFQKPLNNNDSLSVSMDTSTSKNLTGNMPPDSILFNRNFMLQRFLETSLQRWNDYYKFRGSKFDCAEPVSLHLLISEKHSNNLFHIFSSEFINWESLFKLYPATATKRRVSQWKHTLPNEPSVPNVEPMSLTSKSEVTVIDVGCGLGNGTLLNLVSLQQLQLDREHQDQLQSLHLDEINSVVKSPTLKVCFLDGSAEAIRLLRKDPRYQCAAGGTPSLIASNVFDLTLSTSLEAAKDLVSCADIALMLFSLSTVGPYQSRNSHEMHHSGMRNAVANVSKMLMPGGIVLFRDFGRYDVQQLQLNSRHSTQLCENFYIRCSESLEDNQYSMEEATGTGIYFFSLEEVRELFTSVGFEELQLEYVTRLHSQSSKNAKNVFIDDGAVSQKRIWVHGRFLKRG